MARVDTLPHFLTDVADAIREKKGTSETIQASDFDTEIENLASGGVDINDYFNTTISSDIDGSYYVYGGIKKLPPITITSGVTKLRFFFYNLTLSENPIANNSDTSNVTTLESMFQGVKGLTTLDLHNFNFSKVTTLYQMFASASIQNINMSGVNFNSLTNVTNMFVNNNNAKTIDFSNISINNLRDMSSMFTGRGVTTLNVSGIDTSNITTMRYTFSGLSSLTTLDLSDWVTTSVTNMSGLFSGDTQLQHLDIRNFTFDSVTTYDNYVFYNVPVNCEIIVKSQTEKEWVLARRSDFTNVKTVAEYEAEQNA